VQFFDWVKLRTRLNNRLDDDWPHLPSLAQQHCRCHLLRDSECTVLKVWGDKRGLVGLFLSGSLGGMLKMIRLGESALRFVSHRFYIMGEIGVNCEVGEPHV
jgi:hypothetical protein